MTSARFYIRVRGDDEADRWVRALQGIGEPSPNLRTREDAEALAAFLREHQPEKDWYVAEVEN